MFTADRVTAAILLLGYVCACTARADHYGSTHNPQVRSCEEDSSLKLDEAPDDGCDLSVVDSVA